MANSDYLKNKRIKYINCLNNAVATANNLQMSINILSSVINVQNNAYKIDDISAGESYLNNLKSKEERIYSNIVNNVIPGTRSIIDDLECQIMDAEAQEALEI